MARVRNHPYRLCLAALLICVLYLDCVTSTPQYFIEDHCSQTLALNYGSVEAVRLHLTRAPSYPDRMACAMRVQAPQGKRLNVLIEKFEVEGVPDLMCQTGDYLQMTDGPSEQAAPLTGLTPRVCSKPIVHRYDTSGPYFVMRFMSDADLQAGKGISLLVTAFNNGPCSEEQFQCISSNTCIQKSLACDGARNCPDGSDEAMPMCLSEASITIIIVASALFVVAVIVLIVGLVIRRQRMKRARIIKRALRHESLSNTLWCEPKTGGLDISQIDPIWDGGVSHGLPEPETRSRRSVYSFNGNDSDVSSPPYACISNARSLSTRRILSPDDDDDGDHDGDAGNGGDMKKVPSSFWDIQIQELILVANQLNAESQTGHTTPSELSTNSGQTTQCGLTHHPELATRSSQTTQLIQTTHSSQT